MGRLHVYPENVSGVTSPCGSEPTLGTVAEVGAELWGQAGFSFHVVQGRGSVLLSARREDATGPWAQHWSLGSGFCCICICSVSSQSSQTDRLVRSRCQGVGGAESPCRDLCFGAAPTQGACAGWLEGSQGEPEAWLVLPTASSWAPTVPHQQALISLPLIWTQQSGHCGSWWDQR